MSDSDPSARGPTAHINFDAPATLRKWPSLNNQRITDAASPYLVVPVILWLLGVPLSLIVVAALFGAF